MADAIKPKKKQKTIIRKEKRNITTEYRVYMGYKMNALHISSSPIICFELTLIMNESEARGLEGVRAKTQGREQARARSRGRCHRLDHALTVGVVKVRRRVGWRWRRWNGR